MKTTDIQDSFPIHAYGRTELALLYNPYLTPRGAYRRLMRWIDYSPGLRERLEKLSTQRNNRMWTPAQVALIVEALGEP